MVDFLHGVVLSDGQSQGTMSHFVGQAQTQKHMAGVKGAGGTGGAGTGADALGI